MDEVFGADLMFKITVVWWLVLRLVVELCATMARRPPSVTSPLSAACQMKVNEWRKIPMS
jgi:hypothetical protein